MFELPNAPCLIYQREEDSAEVLVDIFNPTDDEQQLVWKEVIALSTIGDVCNYFSALVKLESRDLRYDSAQQFKESWFNWNHSDSFYTFNMLHYIDIVPLTEQEKSMLEILFLGASPSEQPTLFDETDMLLDEYQRIMGAK